MNCAVAKGCTVAYIRHASIGFIYMKSLIKIHAISNMKISV